MSCCCLFLACATHLQPRPHSGQSLPNGHLLLVYIFGVTVGADKMVQCREFDLMTTPKIISSMCFVAAFMCCDVDCLAELYASIDCCCRQWMLYWTMMTMTTT